MDSIAAGCLLAIYEPRLRDLRWMAEPAIVIALPFVAWTLFCVCWDGPLVILFGAVPLMLALWIYLLVERRDWVLNNPVASTLGLLSYSLYLWQQPFTVVRSWPLFPSLAALAACALASYFLVEQPMIQLGKRESLLLLNRGLTSK
jgi:peptidoglycan/LPS O-acetylase OafA/YrhL